MLASRHTIKPLRSRRNVEQNLASRHIREFRSRSTIETNILLAPVQLSFSAKEHFFHGLAQMLRSGLPVSKALEQLAMGANRAAKQASIASRHLDEGFAAAFDRAGFSTVDVEVLAAGEQSGRLEEACERLAEYYANLASARRKIVSASLYPLFMVHLAAFLLSIPKAILESNVGAFVSAVMGILLPVYIAGALIFAAAWVLRGLVVSSPEAERIIRAIPMVGSLFRNASMARFCLVLSLGIRSASGILASLARAGRASRSALVCAAAEDAVKRIRAGSGFAESLSGNAVFPPDLETAFRVSEASGRLDEEMTRWAGIYREKFFATIDAVVVWLPRLLYLAVSIGVGIQIISTAQQVSAEMGNALQLE